jgi:NADPH-dependent 7-cyano-7-deazaguanine reductase QueF
MTKMNFKKAAFTNKPSMIVVKYIGDKLDTVLKKRFKEYFHSFKNNNQNNKFSQHTGVIS